MSSVEWRRVRTVFERASAMDPEARAALLAELSVSDAALAREVVQLLAAEADPRPFLEVPAGGPLAALAAMAEPEELPEGSLRRPRSGDLLGAYRLLERLGEGGMGVVFRAERADGEFEQEVAIKLMRRELVGAPSEERFRRERQILARLEHPNVARLLDGGVTEQGPYLVMEYVRGVSIDVYCERNGLSIPQRLELFATVCDAVHSAHSVLVVHRDLKPANVLVTGRGQVKLLDFGIAQLLDESAVGEPATTRFGVRPMTLEYASPEQLRGEPLSTASDVFSLGVLLFELLVGVHPFDLEGESLVGVERIVCEGEVPQPSSRVPRMPRGGLPQSARALRRALRGDLDTILKQALHRQPSRRYPSAAELRNDLRRYLDHEPVRARPDTLAYRLSRFSRRHAAVVAVVAALLIAIVVGAVSTLHEAHRAERRYLNVRALANTLLFELHDEVRDLPGATAVRERLVREALSYLNLLSADVSDDAALQLELAAAYERVGQVQGDPHYMNLGDLEGALTSYREAFRLRESVWRLNPESPELSRALARSYGHLAVVTSWSGSNEEAIGLSRRALDLLEPARGGSAVEDRDHGRIRAELGWWLIWGGRADEGLGHLVEAIPELERIAARRPDDVELQLDLWRSYTYAYDGWRFSDRHDEALRHLEERGLPFLEQIEREHPLHPRLLYELHVGFDFLGGLRLALGDLEGTVEAHRRSVQYAERLADSDPASRRAPEAVARAYASWGRALFALDRFDEGVLSVQRAIEGLSELLRTNPRNVEIGNMIGNAQRLLCRGFLDRGNPRQALDRCLEAEAVHRKVVEVYRDNPVVRGNLAYDVAFAARAQVELARSMAVAERGLLLRTALADFERSLELLRSLDGEGLLLEVEPEVLEAERREAAALVG
jgi:eukaryotic-like serine/threonine-protein kinase